MIEVHSYAQYLTAGHIQWRSHDFNATKFVHAVKGKPINGYANVLTPEGWQDLREQNRDDAYRWFGLWAVERIRRRLGCSPYVIVPIPSSRAAIGASLSDYASLRLARAIANASHDNGVAIELLRWQAPIRSAHSEGGSRDASQLIGQLTWNVRNLQTCPHVLVDDVLSSGGHLTACARALQSGGINIETSVFAGRTCHNPIDDPFAVPVEYLDLQRAVMLSTPTTQP